MVHIHHAAEHGFTAAAGSYIHGRPDYPPGILEWLQVRIGLGAGKGVVELGAGTGKFTRFLAQTGAQVHVVEPVHAMRAHLLETVPSAIIVDGSAERIGLDDAAVDAVVCAQSFHWFATAAVLAEFARVLRNQGTLGLVWNIPDERVEWVAALNAIIRPYEDRSPYLYRRNVWRSVFPSEHFSPLQCVDYEHTYRGSVQNVIIERIRSLSFIRNLPAAEQSSLIDAARVLIESRPELRDRSEIEFPYRTFAYHCHAVKTAQAAIGGGC